MAFYVQRSRVVASQAWRRRWRWRWSVTYTGFAGWISTRSLMGWLPTSTTEREGPGGKGRRETLIYALGSEVTDQIVKLIKGNFLSHIDRLRSARLDRWRLKILAAGCLWGNAYESTIMSFEQAARCWWNMVQHLGTNSAITLAYDPGCYENHLSDAGLLKNWIY